MSSTEKDAMTHNEIRDTWTVKVVSPGICYSAKRAISRAKSGRLDLSLLLVNDQTCYLTTDHVTLSSSTLSWPQGLMW